MDSQDKNHVATASRAPPPLQAPPRHPRPNRELQAVAKYRAPRGMGEGNTRRGHQAGSGKHPHHLRRVGARQPRLEKTGVGKAVLKVQLWAISGNLKPPRPNANACPCSGGFWAASQNPGWKGPLQRPCQRDPLSPVHPHLLPFVATGCAFLTVTLLDPT